MGGGSHGYIFLYIPVADLGFVAWGGKENIKGAPEIFLTCGP